MTSARAALLVALVVVLSADDRASRLSALRVGDVARRARLPTRPERRVAYAVAAAVGVWLLVGGTAGVVAGSIAGAAGYRSVGAEDRAGARARSEQVARALPVACDLLAACVTAGVAPSAALDDVAAAVSGRLGDVLTGVSRARRLGLSVDDAWAPYLSEGPVALRTLASALSRSAESGASPGRTLDALSSDLREQRRVHGEAAARRAGVAMVAPLGLCFLPAFIVIGVVPFVAGLVGEGLLLAG